LGFESLFHFVPPASFKLPLLTKERVGVRFKELSTLIEMLPEELRRVDFSDIFTIPAALCQ
jgi:hypothetical protein